MFVQELLITCQIYRVPALSLFRLKMETRELMMKSYFHSIQVSSSGLLVTILVCNL